MFSDEYEICCVVISLVIIFNNGGVCRIMTEKYKKIEKKSSKGLVFCGVMVN